MNEYCLNANIYIQAKNGPYGFDIVPGFWNWLNSLLIKGNIYGPYMVYEELTAGDDRLSDWTKERKDAGLFQVPSVEIQEFFREIATHVVDTYPQHHHQPFLEGADPWVIAHAKINNSIVITSERFLNGNPQKVKIPNVCKEFNVKYIDLYTFLRKTGAKFN